MRRILLLQLKRIGDLILTAPAVAALREASPRAELVMVCSSGGADLARLMPGLDKVVEFSAGKLNAKAWSAAVAGPWDACLDFTGTDRAALLMGLSRAQRRIGFAKFMNNKLRRLAASELCTASVRELHTVDFHMALVGKLLGHPVVISGGSEPFMIPKLTKSRAKEKLAAKGVTGRYAIIHPGTAKPEKFWVPSRWAEVAAFVTEETGLPVVLTGSSDAHEKAHLDAIRRSLRVPVADLCGELSLHELVALVAGCNLMTGVDSMAMHLAAMFEHPQVALFGPTNPFHWRPRHKRAVVLQGSTDAPLTQFAPREPKHEMKNVSTQAVVDAIRVVLRTDGRTAGEQ